MTKYTQSKPLPEGMDFHVFFSYRNVPEDQEWMRSLIKELELKGFKCCDHEIEFIPGKEVIENIKDFMSRSKKTVLVFSKEYINSYLCKLEVQYSLYKALSERKHTLIPVKREECEVPDDMNFFTWIDATGKDQLWFTKLTDAIEAPVNIGLSQPFLQVHNYKNFDVIFQEDSSTSCCGKAFTPRCIPDYLSRSSIDFNSDNLTRLVKEISSTRLVRQRLFINPTWFIIVIMYFVVPFCLLAGIAFVIIHNMKPSINDEWPNLTIAIVFLLITSVLGIIWPCYCVAMNIKGKSEMKRLLGDMNRDLLASNMFMTYTVRRMNATVTIYFLYYDVKPCLEFMKSQREKQSSASKGISEIEENNTDAAAETMRRQTETYMVFKDIYKADDLLILLDASFEYFQKFLSGELIENRQSRHTTRGPCLCQYVEETKGNITVIEV